MLHAYFLPQDQVLFDAFNPALECPIQGRLNASRNGNFALYEFDYPGDLSVYTINLWLAPDAVIKDAGFRVYNPTGGLHVTGGGQSGLSPNVSANVISTNKGRHIVQVYNYSAVPIDYELQLVRGSREGQR